MFIKVKLQELYILEQKFQQNINKKRKQIHKKLNCYSTLLEKNLNKPDEKFNFSKKKKKNKIILTIHVFWENLKEFEYPK